MHLLVVTQYFWPENFRVNDLVTEMVKRGHNVTVLTGYPNYPRGEFFPEFIEDPTRFAHFAGAEVVRVPHTARGSGGLRLMLNYLTFAMSATFLGSFKLRRRKFDGIFCYEPSPITVGIPSAAFRFLKKAPLTFWVLDLWPETLQAVGVVKSPFLLRAIGRLVTFIYNRCDRILAQSKSFVSQIKSYAGPHAEVEYFPSWSDTPVVQIDVAPASELEHDPNMFTVVFTGNVGDAQDFPAILRAAVALKEDTLVRWVIIGDGRLSEWLNGEVSRLGLTACFHVLGRFPVDRMPSFFAHADALLVSLKDQPIFSLTIPGKLQSYLAAGKPVLAMLNGEGAAVVEQSGAGIACAAGDSDALVYAVKRMAGMTPDERVAMGECGRRVSATEFNREKLMDRLEQILCGNDTPTLSNSIAKESA